LYDIIYRGHAINIKERIESHLFNTKYLERMREKQENSSRRLRILTECIKIDGRSGINIDEDIYSNESGTNWHILVMKMLSSKQYIREKAEDAFVTIFGLPMGCTK
jgi:hypothetical protein